jgi:hypothetical protein
MEILVNVRFFIGYSNVHIIYMLLIILVNYGLYWLLKDIQLSIQAKASIINGFPFWAHMHTLFSSQINVAI